MKHKYTSETLKEFCKELCKGNKNSVPKAHGILQRARKEHRKRLPTSQVIIGVKHRKLRGK